MTVVLEYLARTTVMAAISVAEGRQAVPAGVQGLPVQPATILGFSSNQRRKAQSFLFLSLPRSRFAFWPKVGGRCSGPKAKATPGREEGGGGNYAFRLLPGAA